jgi:leishmanolysin
VIVFVTARPTAKNTLGWAAACEITAGSHRPVAGQINIDPTKLDPSVYPKSAMIDVVLHELQHLLGFDSSLFKYYAHQPVTTVETLVHNGEYTHISKIITPKAIEAARSHFGCNSIDGVYLENLGGEGTADSHWKQLRFDTELLVGSLDSRLVPKHKNSNPNVSRHMHYQQSR